MTPTGVTASQSDIALALARLMAAQGYSMVETKRLVELEWSASGIVQAREALERIANARTETKGGSIVECRHIARQALSALDRKG